jgi:hypothetical protein
MRAWQDVAAAGMAWLAFGSSRTLPQVMQRQLALTRHAGAVGAIGLAAVARDGARGRQGVEADPHAGHGEREAAVAAMIGRL